LPDKLIVPEAMVSVPGPALSVSDPPVPLPLNGLIDKLDSDVSVIPPVPLFVTLIVPPLPDCSPPEADMVPLIPLVEAPGLIVKTVELLIDRLIVPPLPKIYEPEVLRLPLTYKLPLPAPDPAVRVRLPPLPL